MPKRVTKISKAAQQMPTEKRPLRVADYCRVSTRHEEQYHSLEAQISYYTNYIQRNPKWGFVAVYSDIASGTRTANRPGYQKLMRDCVKRKVDLILVKSLSRFCWDALETIRQIRRLKKMNKGNGVRKIKRYLEEHGIKTVTGKSEWSTFTIDRTLSNEKYVGEVRMQKTFTVDSLTGRREKNEGQLDAYLVENSHEPIIGREIFELVQRMKGNINSKQMSR